MPCHHEMLLLLLLWMMLSHRCVWPSAKGSKAKGGERDRPS